MNPRIKLLLFFLAGVFCTIGVLSLVFPQTEKIEEQSNVITNDTSLSSKQDKTAQEIDVLTAEKTVVNYLKVNNKLPDYYVTKSEARKNGWVASKGNLCDVLQGKAIGGDKFSNREKKLPIKKGRQYYEADLNYNCGRRNADRVVYSNDGLIFVTKDHYKTFEEQ